MSYTELLKKYGKVMANCTLFRGLGEDELLSALGLLKAESRGYIKGELLHQCETPMSRFGMVLEGCVCVSVDDIDGNKTLFASVTAGKTFGESLCCLKIQDSPIYIEAQESSLVLWLSLSELFGKEGDAHIRELERRFTKMLAERTLSMNGRIQALSRPVLRDRLITYFTELSRGKDSFTVPMGREAMAAYMGCNRSALCRVLSAMKQEGIIDYRGRSFRILKRDC